MSEVTEFAQKIEDIFYILGVDKSFLLINFNCTVAKMILIIG